MRRVCLSAFALAVGLCLPLPAQNHPAAEVITVAPGAAQFQVSSLVFDHAMLVNLVNQAIQNNDSITNFNYGADAGVVSVTIHNSGGQAGICYLLPTVRQANGSRYNCDSGNVVIGPLLQTRSMILPGQTVTENLAGLETVSGGGYNGSFCQGLSNLINSNFGNNSSGGSGSGNGSGGFNLKAVGGVVEQLLQLQLVVCLEAATATGSPTGPETCSNIAVFTQPPALTTQLGQILVPNDVTVASPLPTFIWTPSLFQGSSAGLSYELVLSQNRSGDPWYAVQVPNGQTFYQYQATDRALTPGTRYWFHIVTLNASNQQPVGGSAGQGWAQPQSWFLYQPGGILGRPLLTLPDLDAFVREHGSPQVVAALQGMLVEGVAPALTLNDPDVAALTAKPSEIRSISVEKY